MERIPSIEDDMNGVVTYRLADGRYCRIDAMAVREYGMGECLRRMGFGDAIPTKRMPVMQCGVMIGTVPGDFDPLAIRSRSFLYDVRPGDFRREGNRWIASKTLGGSDLECVPGFMPS